MDPAHVVFLIGVALTVVAIAGYLIAIALILKRVVDRLVTILGAVEAVTETAQPVGAIVDEINRDLEAGRKLMEDGVARLEASREPAAGATVDPPRHAADRHPSEAPGLGTATATAPPPAHTDTDTDAEDVRPPPRGGGRGWWNRET